VGCTEHSVSDYDVIMLLRLLYKQMAKAMEDGKLRPRHLRNRLTIDETTFTTIPDDWPHAKFNFHRRRGWSGRIPVCHSKVSLSFIFWSLRQSSRAQVTSVNRFGRSTRLMMCFRSRTFRLGISLILLSN